MRNKYSEQELTRILGQNVEEPEAVERKIEEAYEMIRNHKGLERQGSKRIWRRMELAGIGIASAILLGVGGLAANPVLAAKIPIIGRIFQVEEEKVSYPGDYSSHAEQLAEPSAEGDKTADSPYTVTSNGTAITISEYYSDGAALYLGINIEMENGFPEAFMAAAKDTDLGYSVIQMESAALADFAEGGFGRVTFDPACGVEAPYLIEGNFVDNHTFAGIIRIALTDMAALNEAGEVIKISAAPGHFSYELAITRLYIPGIDNVVRDEEGEWVSFEDTMEEICGEWKFSIDVNTDTSGMEIRNVDETNAEGVGIGQVRKTPYEMEAQIIVPEGKNAWDYVVFMTDASGERLESRGGKAQTYNVYRKDVSKVSIGVCTESDFMEYKGDTEKLWETAVFSTEVSFE